MKKYSNCFIGSEAVDWFVGNLFASTRAEACQMCCAMLKRGFFRHVAGKNVFKVSPVGARRVSGQLCLPGFHRMSTFSIGSKTSVRKGAPA